MKLILAFIFLAVATHAETPATRKDDLKPLPAAPKPKSTHEPYDPTDCSLCHKNADAKNPGPVTTAGNKLCLDCHDKFPKILAAKSSHAAAKARCVNCHNPHNANQPKLLLDEAGALCLGCHTALKKFVDDAASPHAPVAAGECTACHNPHGADNQRLLKRALPATFYAPYDDKAYALCFGCHDAKLAAAPTAAKETQFRDGSRNLHYLHVNKTERGRACRACHDPHAAPQDHLLRRSVPYGPNGWPLTIQYTKTPTGGSCTKTCHRERSYNNTGAVPPKKESTAP
jgi:predicted CXXCH cytochrome family protein